MPGGNPTILIPAQAVPPSQLAATAQKLMSETHLQAEQVGSLSLPATPTLPHLQMMGGEFCVNATRACAALLANVRLLGRDTTDCCAGYMTVSGADTPILLATAPTAPLLSSTIAQLQESPSEPTERQIPPQQPCPRSAKNDAPPPSTAREKAIPALPARFQRETPSLAQCPHLADSPTSMDWPMRVTHPLLYTAARLTCPITPATFEAVDNDKVIVHLPGISHLLIPVSDGHTPNFPESPHTCEQLAARYRKQYGLHTLPASGTIWYKKLSDKLTILPAVYVKETNSLCLETACGSASLALSLHTCHVSGQYESQASSSYAIQQPSGHILTVTISRHTPTSCYAWVAGMTHIVATGYTSV